MHRRAVKAQTRLRTCTVKPQTSLLAFTKYRSRVRLIPNIRLLSPLDLNRHLKEALAHMHSLARVSLLTYTKYRSRGRRRPNIRPIVPQDLNKHLKADLVHMCQSLHFSHTISMEVDIGLDNI